MLTKLKKNTSSIRMRITLMVAIAMIVLGTSVFLNIVPKVEKITTELTQDNMLNTAKHAIELTDTVVAYMGEDIAFKYDNLKRIADNTKVANMETCYMYMVDKNGSILYHPDKNKIGTPVVNDAIKQVISKLQNGIMSNPSVIEYEYQNESKYAAYVIDNTGNYVVIVSADKDDALASVAKLKYFIAGMSIIITVVYCILCAILVCILLKPIKQLDDAIKKLAIMDFSDQDGIIHKLANRDGEIGAISKSVLSLRDSIANMVTRLQNNSTNVYTVSADVKNESNRITDVLEQMEIASNEIAESATNQAQDVQSVSESIVNISNMISDANNEIDKLKNDSDGVKRSEQNADQIIQKLSTINKQSKDSISEICNQTKITNAAVSNIQKAVDVISSIAAQTNLLSLNASIEAARAGESGKGFAVVASEIKKLAEESSSSAKQIAKILENLTLESEKTVGLMTIVQDNFEQQNTSVIETQKVFADIDQKIEMVIDSINHVENKVFSLDSSRAEIVALVQNLSSIAENNAAGAQETAASVSELMKSTVVMKTKSDQLATVANELNESVCQINI